MRKIRGLLSGLACCTVLLLSAAPAEADGWEFSLTPYLWAVGLDGTVSVRTPSDEVTVDLDVGFSDIWDNLEMAVPVHFEAKAPVWTLIAEVNFASVSQELGAIQGEGEFDALIVELLAGWQWTETVEILFGSRYMDMDVALQTGEVLSKENVDVGQSWVDPVIGIRYGGQLNRRGTWHSNFRADVGGFGLGSDLTWNVRVGIARNLGYTTRLVFGYHWLDVDYDNKGLLYDVLEQGPEIGLMFRW